MSRLHLPRRWSCLLAAVVGVPLAVGWGAGPAEPPREITNSIGMKLVRIPAGKFVMGARKFEQAGGDDSKTLHEVVITKPFYMGVYEVTQAEYEKVLGVNPARFNLGNGGGPDFPVEQVSWADAVNFGDKLSKLPDEKKAGRGYRLPTEAEWEYACRAGSTTVFHFGDSLSSRQAAFDGGKPYGADKGPALKQTVKVGSFPANAFGLYDMHGNVWEWCADWYGADYYKNSPREDPQGPEKGTARVLRGGAWSTDGERCRSSHRYRYEPPKFAPNRSYSVFGFRVVCP